MNILFYCNWPNKQDWIDSLKKKFRKKDICVWPDIKDKEKNKIKYAIVWKLPKKALNQLKNLKIIFSLGAGVDHLFIDGQLPKFKIVRIKDTIMCQGMLNYVKTQINSYQLKLYKFYINKNNRVWNEEFNFLDNSDLKIGILGLGYIGTFIAKGLIKNGYKVQGFKRTKSKKKSSLKIYYNKSQLNKFISTSDIIINILPNTSKTKNFINNNFLKRMKKKSLLINIGRGSTVDENDLIHYAKKNKNFMAILDVFKKEPLQKNHLFWKQENIIITPHIAGLTNIKTSVDQIYNNYVNFKKTGKLKNLVNLKKQY